MKTIGVLLDHRIFRNIRRRRTGHERVGLYRQAAGKYGFTTLFMSLRGTDLKRRKTTGLIWRKGGYSTVTRPIPAVIHNRAMPFDRSQLGKLKRLGGIRYVFNSRNRYGKYRIHQLLRRNSAFRSHLPVSRPFGKQSLRGMLAVHNSLYVKPQSGSVGSGIIRLRRLNGAIWSVRTSHGTVKIPQKRLFGMLSKLTRGKSYLIQKSIDLATYKGRPYDIRVSVQRGTGGFWRVTGMVGKVARRGSHVTNLARGGTVKRCEVLFQGSRLPVHMTMARVSGLSLRMAAYLATHLHRLADVGLDIGVDRRGKPYFIEMNGRDQRYSFAKGGLSSIFYNTYKNPIRYAIHLSRRKQWG